MPIKFEKVKTQIEDFTDFFDSLFVDMLRGCKKVHCSLES